MERRRRERRDYKNSCNNSNGGSEYEGKRGGKQIVQHVARNIVNECLGRLNRAHAPDGQSHGIFFSSARYEIYTV